MDIKVIKTLVVEMDKTEAFQVIEFIRRNLPDSSREFDSMDKGAQLLADTLSAEGN